MLQSGAQHQINIASFLDRTIYNPYIPHNNELLPCRHAADGFGDMHKDKTEKNLEIKKKLPKTGLQLLFHITKQCVTTEVTATFFFKRDHAGKYNLAFFTIVAPERTLAALTLRLLERKHDRIPSVLKFIFTCHN